MKYDNPGEEMLSWSTKWIMSDFYWPEMIGIFQNTEFSNPIVPEIKFIPHFSYYMLNPNFDYDNQREITFPETLNESLNAYYSAPQDLQIILDSAIPYSVSAMELRFQKEH